MRRALPSWWAVRTALPTPIDPSVARPEHSFFASDQPRDLTRSPRFRIRTVIRTFGNPFNHLARGHSFFVPEFEEKVFRSHWSSSDDSLCPDNFHKFLHRFGALLQRCLFFVSQLDLDNLLQTPRAELAGNAYKQTFDSVFTLQVCCARQNLLF